MSDWNTAFEGFNNAVGTAVQLRQRKRALDMEQQRVDLEKQRHEIENVGLDYRNKRAKHALDWSLNPPALGDNQQRLTTVGPDGVNFALSEVGGKPVKTTNLDGQTIAVFSDPRGGQQIVPGMTPWLKQMMGMPVSGGGVSAAPIPGLGPVDEPATRPPFLPAPAQGGEPAGVPFLPDVRRTAGGGLKRSLVPTTTSMTPTGPTQNAKNVYTKDGPPTVLSVPSPSGGVLHVMEKTDPDTGAPVYEKVDGGTISDRDQAAGFAAMAVSRLKALQDVVDDWGNMEIDLPKALTSGRRGFMSGKTSTEAAATIPSDRLSIANETAKVFNPGAVARQAAVEMDQESLLPFPEGWRKLAPMFAPTNGQTKAALKHLEKNIEEMVHMQDLSEPYARMRANRVKHAEAPFVDDPVMNKDWMDAREAVRAGLISREAAIDRLQRQYPTLRLK
jgi:hypothetical protein